MPNFLDGQLWRYALFAVFVVLGVVGLVLTWVAGTAGQRPPARARPNPPRTTVESSHPVLLAVVIVGLLLLVALAELVGPVLREDDEVRSRPGRHDDRGPG